MIWNRLITILALIGGVISVLIAAVTGNVILTIPSAFFFALSLLIWKYGYILMPYFTTAAGIIEVRSGYEIPPARDYIIKKAENGYYATKFLEIKYYDSIVDKSDVEKAYRVESFEKALASLNSVVKISLLVSTIDLSKHIEEIKTRRGSAEAKRAKMASNNADAVKLDREIAMYDRQLDRITHGERPLEVTSFASTTAFGVTKEEASSRVRRQSKEIKTILSSTLGADVKELADEDMLRCFEWDRFIPADPEQLRDEVF
ncbi:hypothetical protein KAW38_00075 [Candidatus Micrarchaeota archaeon]|nr:hypothetical protein [Candidatus Micrarchaeota archaeon]